MFYPPGVFVEIQDIEIRYCTR